MLILLLNIPRPVTNHLKFGTLGRKIKTILDEPDKTEFYQIGRGGDGRDHGVAAPASIV
jgi:hypothetical protein